MEKKTFTVPNISCGHCVHTIKSEVSEVPGVKVVEVVQTDKQVTIEWEQPATWEKIEALLVEINYPPATSPNVVLS